MTLLQPISGKRAHSDGATEDLTVLVKDSIAAPAASPSGAAAASGAAAGTMPGPGAGAGRKSDASATGVSRLPYSTLVIVTGPFDADTLYSALSDSLDRVEARLWAGRAAEGGKTMVRFIVRRGDVAGDSGGA